MQLWWVFGCAWSKIVQSLLTFWLCPSTYCAAVQTFGLCKSTDNGCGYFLGCIWTQIVQLRNSIPTFQKLRSFVAYLNLVGFTHFSCYFFQSKSANFYTFCISEYSYHISCLISEQQWKPASERLIRMSMDISYLHTCKSPSCLNCLNTLLQGRLYQYQWVHSSVHSSLQERGGEAV